MSNETMTTPGIAGWIEFSGPDTNSAKEFYKTAMNWDIAEIPMKDGSSYSAIMVGESPIGGFSKMPTTEGAWTIYVTVADVDAQIKQARQNGATVLNDPMDIAGVGRLAKIRDPQGGEIAMITYESMQS